MDDQARTDRLMEAVDRVALEDGSPEMEAEELRPYLALAADLRRALPPVQADPLFESALRARLMARPTTPWWRRLLSRDTKPRRHEDTNQAREEMTDVGRGPVPRRPVRGGSPARRYALAAAAVAVVVAGAAIVYQGRSQEQPVQMASQPALEASARQADSATPADQRQADQPPVSESQPAPVASGYAPGDPATPKIAGEAATAMLAPAATPAPDATSVPAAMPMAAQPLAQGALPALPPISASQPPRIMGGMGGAPGVDGQVPERQIAYELAAELPELGPRVTVYGYRQPVSSPEENRDLAARLGFDPSGLRPIEGSEGAYVVTEEGKGYLEIHGPGGAIVYSSNDEGRKLMREPGQPVLEDELAAEAATRWLEERELLPPDAGTPLVSLPFPEAAFKEVTFQPAEPRGIVTPNPRVTVSVDGAGSVTDAYVLWPEVETALEYPAREAESAWSMLEGGEAETRFEGEHNRPDLDLGVRVSSAETGYALTFAQGGQAYLQPVIVFRGESSGGGASLPFTAWAPAVAGE